MNAFEESEKSASIESEGSLKCEPEFYGMYIEQLDSLTLSSLEQLRVFSQDHNLQSAHQPYNHLSYQVQQNNTGVFDILNTSPSIIHKIIGLLVINDQEIVNISQQIHTSYFDQIIIFGEEYNLKDTISPGEYPISVARLLPLVSQLHELVKRLNSIIFNMIGQLAALTRIPMISNCIHTGLSSLAKALSLMLVIDHVFIDNHNWHDGWKQYLNMFKVLKQNLNDFGITKLEFNDLQKKISKYEKTLVQGKCFQATITQKFDPNVEIDQKDLIANNKVLNKFILEYLKNELKSLDNMIENKNDSFIERNKVIQILSLFALHKQLFGKVDSSLYKKFWLLQKRTPYINLKCHINFKIDVFLNQYVESQQKIGRVDPKNVEENIIKYIKQSDLNLQASSEQLFVDFQVLRTKLESDFLSDFQIDNNEQIDNNIQLKINSLMQTILIATQCKNMFQDNILAHLDSQQPISINLIKSYIKNIYVLKQIYEIVNKKQNVFDIQIMYRFIAKQMYQILLPSFNKYKEDVDNQMKKNKLNQKTYEIFSVLTIFIDTMKSTPSTQRLKILEICSDILSEKNVIKQILEIKYLLRKIYFLINYKVIVEQICKLDFMYWTEELIPKIFEYYYNNHQQIFMLQSFIDALCDSMYLLDKISDNKKTSNQYISKIKDHIEQIILNPLAIKIEDYTRLYLSHQIIDGLQGINPFKENYLVINAVLNLKTLLINDQVIDIKHYLSNYIDKKLYKINAINLKDSKVYQQIRTLINNIFGLDLLTVNIPQYDQERNIDLFEVIKNINKFSQEYTYNIYEQSFQQSKKAESLAKTIQIIHIQEFIQSHGQGIQPTTVNQVYLFIYKKFNIFSQFLCDELVFSLLMQEDNYCQKQKNFSQLIYPYERAEQLEKEIQSLQNEQNNYVVKFRKLITQVGNSLGFLRLIETANINLCCQQAQNYQDLTDNQLFLNSELKKEQLSPQLLQVFQQYDQQFNQLRQNLTSKNEYFALIKQALNSIMTDEISQQLKLFYLILPTLQINHIESVLQSIEAQNNKDYENSFITNDGFVLGCAFFLKLLNQNTQYDLLNWDKEIQKKLQLYNKTTEKEKESTPPTIAFQQEIFLRKSRLQKQEFEILFNSLEVSRLIFN